MADSLTTVEDLADYPDAPTSESAVEAACDSIRGDAGWHIAPLRSESVVVEATGSDRLMLPNTLQLVSVQAVRTLGSRDVVDVPGPFLVDRAGFVRRPGGWTRGGVYEVEFTHGYEVCPPALLPLVIERAKVAATGKTAGSVRIGSLSIGGGSSDQGDRALSRYRIPRSR